MASTPVWQLPYPLDSDPADGPDGFKDLADRLEVLLSQLRAAGAIPGEVKLWPGSALPEQATYGRWVWADGAVYVTSEFPLASAHIATQWRTSAGAADPGAATFRLPDMRGLTPDGLDALPGGTRANRMARAVAITIAARTGEELHTITLAESAPHGHGVNDPTHAHIYTHPTAAAGSGGPGGYGTPVPGAAWTDSRATGISITSAGGGGAHENVQPSVFVPWICKLDD